MSGTEVRSLDEEDHNIPILWPHGADLILPKRGSLLWQLDGRPRLLPGCGKLFCHGEGCAQLEFCERLDGDWAIRAQDLLNKVHKGALRQGNAFVPFRLR